MTTPTTADLIAAVGDLTTETTKLLDSVTQGRDDLSDGLIQVEDAVKRCQEIADGIQQGPQGEPGKKGDDGAQGPAGVEGISRLPTEIVIFRANVVPSGYKPEPAYVVPAGFVAGSKL